MVGTLSGTACFSSKCKNTTPSCTFNRFKTKETRSRTDIEGASNSRAHTSCCRTHTVWRLLRQQFVTPALQNHNPPFFSESSIIYCRGDGEYTGTVFDAERSGRNTTEGSLRADA